jgi:Flp pilus assembly protein TadG
VSRPAARGQILPVWIVAILTILILTFMALNYGNTLRWQMRAQNAADAAAQAVMAIQTQHFNELTAALYASNVEEYRIRALQDGMLNALNGAGGCTGAPPTPKAKAQALFTTGTGTCDQVFNTLLPYYEEAVVRYGADVAELNNVATLATFSNWSADSASMLAHISSSSHCNTVSTTTVINDGGDCQFQYTLNLSARPQRAGSRRLQRRVPRARRYLGEQYGNRECAVVRPRHGRRRDLCESAAAHSALCGAPRRHALRAGPGRRHRGLGRERLATTRRDHRPRA